MTELHVHIPDDLADRLSAEAAQRGVDAETLAGEILAEQLPASRSLGFASLGRSTTGRGTAEDEDMLTDGFAFVGVGAGGPDAPSAAEAERALEDGLDEGFAR
ncbi:MAG TPA: hypothetical protein VMH41_13660 [Mycobacteriales bacterium]|nr:hypothetical protein [Mycobacteriales bacterium]